MLRTTVSQGCDSIRPKLASRRPSERLGFGGGIDHYAFTPHTHFWIFFWISFAFGTLRTQIFRPGGRPPRTDFFARTPPPPPPPVANAQLRTPPYGIAGGHFSTPAVRIWPKAGPLHEATPAACVGRILCAAVSPCCYWLQARQSSAHSPSATSATRSSRISQSRNRWFRSPPPLSHFRHALVPKVRSAGLADHPRTSLPPEG